MASSEVREIEHLLDALSDDEVLDVHRTVSRYARAAYGRTERYQQNYENGMIAGRSKIAAAREKIAKRGEARA